MRPLLYYAFVFVLSLAPACQTARAQHSVLNSQSAEEFEGEFSSTQEEEAAPVVRPKLKRVSEISLNLFDQENLNANGGMQIPKQSPMAVSGNPSTTSRYGVTPKVVAWTAPDVAYRRLIFEEPGLERHGFTDTEVRQHIRSSAKFYARSIALPIIVLRQRNCPCDNNLGWGTPGTCPR